MLLHLKDYTQTLLKWLGNSRIGKTLMNKSFGKGNGLSPKFISVLQMFTLTGCPCQVLKWL